MKKATWEYSIIKAGFKFTVKPFSDSLGKSNGLLALNNVTQYKQTLMTS